MQSWVRDLRPHLLKRERLATESFSTTDNYRILIDILTNWLTKNIYIWSDSFGQSMEQIYANLSYIWAITYDLIKKIEEPDGHLTSEKRMLYEKALTKVQDILEQNTGKCIDAVQISYQEIIQIYQLVKTLEDNDEDYQQELRIIYDMALISYKRQWYSEYCVKRVRVPSPSRRRYVGQISALPAVVQAAEIEQATPGAIGFQAVTQVEVQARARPAVQPLGRRLEDLEALAVLV